MNHPITSILFASYKVQRGAGWGGILRNISNKSDSVSSGYPNTETRDENTTRSGVFLTKFEVFG